MTLTFIVNNLAFVWRENILILSIYLQWSDSQDGQMLGGLLGKWYREYTFRKRYHVSRYQTQDRLDLQKD